MEPVRIGQFLFARIVADNGLDGIGEAGAWGHVRAAASAIDSFAEYLTGKSAFAIEHHWNVMHRFAHFTGAAINAAISAIDIALWDLKAKTLGVPVFELIGGAVRTKARLYGHAYDKTAEGVADHCAALAASGFTAIGHLNPLLDEALDAPHFKTFNQFIDDAVRNVSLFREKAGQHCDLLIEIHRRMTRPEALVFMKEIACFRPMWVEDPLRPDDLGGFAWLSERTGIPIATGERFTGMEPFRQLLESGGVQFARTSLGICGGITGARKIAALAEAHNVQIAPHTPLSPVSLAACLQLDAAVANFAIQEFPTGLEAHSLVSTGKLLGLDITDWSPKILDGHIAIPQDPGLGLTFRDDVESRFPPMNKEIRMRHYADGAPMDQ